MSKRHVLRFESKRDALLPRPAFARRVARKFGVASALVGVSLLGGMPGYQLPTSTRCSWRSSGAGVRIPDSGCRLRRVRPVRSVVEPADGSETATLPDH